MPVIDIHAHYGTMPYSLERQTPQQIADLAKAFGIERTCLSSSVAIAVDMVAGNQQLAEAIQGNAALLGYVVVNPNSPEESVEEMRKYLTSPNFVGAKMHATHHGQPLDSPETMQIVKSLLRYDKPLLVHVPDSKGLVELETLAKAYASCPIILANMGNGDWPLALHIAKRATNLMLDVGGADPAADRIKHAVEQVGAHRLLFGTNTPLVHPLYALGMVRDAEIPAFDKERILHRNAAKLLRLA